LHRRFHLEGSKDLKKEWTKPSVSDGKDRVPTGEGQKNIWKGAIRGKMEGKVEAKVHPTDKSKIAWNLREKNICAQQRSPEENKNRRRGGGMEKK